MAVWAALITSQSALTPAQKHALTAPNAQRLTTANGTAGAGRIYVDADPRHYRISIKGEWWYRGVHTVSPEGRGSRVTYDVYNIAPGLGWWAAQLAQGPAHARQMQRQFRVELEQLSRALGCASRLE